MQYVRKLIWCFKFSVLILQSQKRGAEDNMTEPEKEDLKNRIILFSLDKFMKDSVASVRMDDIAAEMGISKRTLYELFSSKEQLVLGCVLHVHAEVEADMKRRIGETSDIITVSMTCFSMLIKMSKSISYHNFDNIDKFPAIKKFIEEKNRLTLTRVRSFLNTGIREGLFRNDINPEVVVKTVEILIYHMVADRTEKDLTLEDLVYSIILVELRGIATPKGLELIEKFDISNI